MTDTPAEATVPADQTPDTTTEHVHEEIDVDYDVEVPNITPGAVSGLDGVPLPAKKPQLAGSVRDSGTVPEGQSDPYAGSGDAGQASGSAGVAPDTTVVGDPASAPVAGVDQEQSGDAGAPDAGGAGTAEEPSAPADASGNDALQTVTGAGDTASDQGQRSPEEQASEPGPDPLSDATVTSAPGGGMDGGGVGDGSADTAPEGSPPAEPGQ